MSGHLPDAPVPQTVPRTASLMEKDFGPAVACGTAR